MRSPAGSLFTKQPIGILACSASYLFVLGCYRFCVIVGGRGLFFDKIKNFSRYLQIYDFIAGLGGRRIYSAGINKGARKLKQCFISVKSSTLPLDAL